MSNISEEEQERIAEVPDVLKRTLQDFEEAVIMQGKHPDNRYHINNYIYSKAQILLLLAELWELQQ